MVDPVSLLSFGMKRHVRLNSGRKSQVCVTYASRTCQNFGADIFGASSTNVRKCYKMKKKDRLSLKPPGEGRESQINLLRLEKEVADLILVPSFFVGSFALAVALGI